MNFGMNSLLLVGTDTGVGKTTLAVGLLRLAARAQLGIAPYKPVESGYSTDRPDDSDAASLLRASSRNDLTLADVCPYRLSQAVAPAVAARMEAASIDPVGIVAQALRLRAVASALLIETAGGLLSPLAPNFTARSLISSLRDALPVDILLVAANRLGAINHAALSAEALLVKGIKCSGVVLMNTADGDPVVQATNPDEIVRATGLPALGTLPYLGDRARDPDVVADSTRNHLELSSLFGGRLTHSPQRPQRNPK